MFQYIMQSLANYRAMHMRIKALEVDPRGLSGHALQVGLHCCGFESLRQPWQGLLVLLDRNRTVSSHLPWLNACGKWPRVVRLT